MHKRYLVLNTRYQVPYLRSRILCGDTYVYRLVIYFEVVILPGILVIQILSNVRSIYLVILKYLNSWLSITYRLIILKKIIIMIILVIQIMCVIPGYLL